MDRNYADYLPPMLFGEELKKALYVYPEYDEQSRQLPAAQRLMLLLNLYKVFIPSSMAVEIYHKIYMMAAMSLRQKGTIDSIRNANQNFRSFTTGEFLGVVTGASSGTIIGDSGVGKTTCIQRAVKLLGPIIEVDRPLQKIIPAVMVSCPFDCSYKGFLYQTLMTLDEMLGTSFYEKAMKANVNTQQMMGMVTQLCRMHVGVLIIDEIQFLAEHRTGKQLYRMLLQLINQAGIGVIMVGTHECTEFFIEAPQMARRTVGLEYHNLDYDEEFFDIAKALYRLQYVSKKSELNEELTAWLYEHTAGNVANLMSLLHDSQEMAIQSGIEILDKSTMLMAYNRMRMLHGFIEQDKTLLSAVTKKKKIMSVENINGQKTATYTISELAKLVIDTGRRALDVYKECFEVEEISI